MTIDINSAMNAYNLSLKRASNAIKTGDIEAELRPVGAVKAVGQEDAFYDMIKSGVKRAETVQRHAEDLSKLAIAGQADMREVALAITNAENTLQTVIALRDKIVSAYQEIMRMPM